MAEKVAAPKPTLTVADAVAIIVGIVIGSGIFRSPPDVAANTTNEALFLFAWLLGGIISFIGALCYAELATTYPHAGGEYHFLHRAFGRDIAFLFAWARATVIQTGSIAMLGFVFGDYASQIFSFGSLSPSLEPYSPAIYAALAAIVLTTLNVMGVQQGKWTQNLLTAAKVVGLLLVVAVGLFFALPPEPAPATQKPSSGAFGMAMIFVLLTYGGWNEAAYISAELRDVRRNMLKALMLGIALITVIYLLVNFAYLKGLGLSGIAKSEAVAADLLRKVWGEIGAKFISVLIAISALGAMNATIFTGARTNFAWGQDFNALGFLGVWNERASTPTNALLVQGLISLGLVALGAWTRQGFSTMVDYTAPVFWFFFLLTGLSLFILRTSDAKTQRPFAVPLYPFIPLLFCVFCVYMLQSSLSYTGVGALVGVGVLLVGIPVLMLVRRYEG